MHVGILQNNQKLLPGDFINFATCSHWQKFIMWTFCTPCTSRTAYKIWWPLLKFFIAKIYGHTIFGGKYWWKLDNFGSWAVWYKITSKSPATSLRTYAPTHIFNTNIYWIRIRVNFSILLLPMCSGISFVAPMLGDASLGFSININKHWTSCMYEFWYWYSVQPLEQTILPNLILNILVTLKEILLLLPSKVDPRVLTPCHKKLYLVPAFFIVIGYPLTELSVSPLAAPNFSSTSIGTYIPQHFLLWFTLPPFSLIYSPKVQGPLLIGISGTRPPEHKIRSLSTQQFIPSPLAPLTKT